MNDKQFNKLLGKFKTNQTQKDRPKVSIIMPTMRVGGLDVLFESLKKQTFQDFELILVDSIYKYRKDVVQKLSSNYSFVTKHVEPTKNNFPNACYCNASNTGIIHASADILLIITDYTYLPQDCVAKHFQFHQENPAINLGYMCPHQYRSLPAVNPEFPTYEKPDVDSYVRDLDAGKLDNVMWTIFQEPFAQDPESLPLDSMGNADTKLFMAPGPGDHQAFNGKNESLKTEAALFINGYDEELDGTHCWQDNIFSDMLVRKLGFTWMVDATNKVYIINPRFIMPQSKWVRHYETNKVIWDRKKSENYQHKANDWDLTNARNKILLQDMSSTGKEVASPAKELPFVSVIVTTNRVGGLDVLFESLKKQTYQNFELILVDAIYNKRKDIVDAKSKEYNFKVKHMAPVNNSFPISNYCRSINTGLCAATGSVVYMGCDYSIMDEDTLLTHATFQANTPETHVLIAPVDYYSINKNKISPKFPMSKHYGHNRSDSKFNMLVASEDEYTKVHNEWSDNYYEDLEANLFKDTMWSSFGKEYTYDSPIDEISDFNTYYTAKDSRFTERATQVSSQLCNLKNNSFKLSLLLNANGMDEELDGTHGFQDTDLTNRLAALYSAKFYAVNRGRVASLNIRQYLEPRKILKGYNNHQLIVNRQMAPVKITNNLITQFKDSKEPQSTEKDMKYDICVVGGAGHIGAPLAILFASRGLKVLVHDINDKSIDAIKSGTLPFIEKGCNELLRDVLGGDKLSFTTNPADVASARYVIVTIGTEVDEFHNPRIGDIIKCIDRLPIDNSHTLILRSTVFPGVSQYVARYLKDKGVEPLIAYCPERIVQGNAIEEMQSLPQIISGTSTQAVSNATDLFKLIAPTIVNMEVMEAEFAKLFSNTYRYIQFAATNQFYEMATAAGLDYSKILAGAKQNYSRLRDLPGPGFSAGACLFKDCLQLCAYSEGKFSLGHSAITANEGLPAFLVKQLESKHNLLEKTVGLCGMSFKANIDDPRSSLSYKLKKILTFKAKKVLTTDPFVKDPDILPLQHVVDDSDILIVCVPHTEYSVLKYTNKEIVNLWYDK